MNLTQLQYFKTVAETGKILLAAEKLYVSAPALSIAIAKLEKELGVKLFDRSRNKIELNEQGRIYLTYVNQVLGDLNQAKQKIQESQQVGTTSEKTSAGAGSGYEIRSSD